MLLWSVALAFAGHARAAAELTLSPQSRLWFEGNSNLHPYSVEVTQIDVSTALVTSRSPIAPAHRRLQKALGGYLQHLHISLPVYAFVSGKKGMDKKMRAALRADEYPVVVFRLCSYDVREEMPQQDAFRVMAAGDLSVNGQTQRIELQTEVRVRDRTIEFRGEKELLMSQFGIDPPTALLGTLKTDDRILVHFEWVLIK